MGLQREAAPDPLSEEDGQGVEEELCAVMDLPPLSKVLGTERQQLRWLMKKVDQARLHTGWLAFQPQPAAIS